MVKLIDCIIAFFLDFSVKTEAANEICFEPASERLTLPWDPNKLFPSNGLSL